MHLDAQGVASDCRLAASPHCDARPLPDDIRLVVIHNISLPAGTFGSADAERLFLGTLDTSLRKDYAALEGLRVSAHFLIRRDGETVQFVPCSLRAWHCGPSSWCGWQRCNDFSIGIELEGCDDQPFDERQYRRLERLLAAIRERWPNVTLAGHSEIAPGRKTDPGPHFDWPRFRPRTPA